MAEERSRSLKQSWSIPAPTCIISTAQQARPNVIGHIEPVLAQFMMSSNFETTNSADELGGTGLVVWIARLWPWLARQEAAGANSAFLKKAAESCLLSCLRAIAGVKLHRWARCVSPACTSRGSQGTSGLSESSEYPLRKFKDLLIWLCRELNTCPL
jgi:hypothetical protein